MSAELTWEQKLAAMQALEPSRPSLRMIEPGLWHCRLPLEIGGNGMLASDFGSGDTPAEAVETAWAKIINLADGRYLVAGSGLARRHFRWAGFMWAEVPQ